VLGEVVREEFGSDIFAVIGYPTSLRPFYTQPDPINPSQSLSFDFFVRFLNYKYSFTTDLWRVEGRR